MKTCLKKYIGFGLALLLVLMSAACGGKDEATSSDPANTANSQKTGKPIIVGGTNITEQAIMVELYGQALEAAGFPVEKKPNIGGTLVVFEALKNGEINFYPGYTGTYLMNILKQDAIYDKQQVYDKVKKEFNEKFQIDLLDQAPFNNTFVLVTRKEIAEKYKLKTLSDLSKVASELRLCLIPEFETRKDGLPGLQQAYGGFRFKSMKLFDVGLKYKSLTDNQVDVTVGYGTDGQIAGYGLVALEDDKNFWPPYYGAPAIRSEVLKEHPGAADVINKVTSLLTNEVMASLNWKVDGDNKEEPEEVAKAFLKEHGLLE